MRTNKTLVSEASQTLTTPAIYAGTKRYGCMCEGCGAPVLANESACSYCRRPVDVVEVTTLQDTARRFVPAMPQPEPDWR